MKCSPTSNSSQPRVTSTLWTTTANKYLSSLATAAQTFSCPRHALGTQKLYNKRSGFTKQKYYHPTLDRTPNYSANDVEMRAIYTNNALSFHNHTQIALQYAVPVNLLCTTTLQPQTVQMAPANISLNPPRPIITVCISAPKKHSYKITYLLTYLYTKALYSSTRKHFGKSKFPPKLTSHK